MIYGSYTIGGELYHTAIGGLFNLHRQYKNTKRVWKYLRKETTKNGKTRYIYAEKKGTGAPAGKLGELRREQTSRKSTVPKPSVKDLGSNSVRSESNYQNKQRDHKYLRKEMTKNGNWRYIYDIGQKNGMITNKADETARQERIKNAKNNEEMGNRLGLMGGTQNREPNSKLQKTSQAKSNYEKGVERGMIDKSADETARKEKVKNAKSNENVGKNNDLMDGKVKYVDKRYEDQTERQRRADRATIMAVNSNYEKKRKEDPYAADIYLVDIANRNRGTRLGDWAEDKYRSTLGPKKEKKSVEEEKANYEIAKGQKQVRDAEWKRVEQAINKIIDVQDKNFVTVTTETPSKRKSGLKTDAERQENLSRKKKKK